jgi:hypothetical protein
MNPKVIQSSIAANFSVIEVVKETNGRDDGRHNERGNFFRATAATMSEMLVEEVVESVFGQR